MIYIGGGAGMAPLRSHIFHLFHTQKTKRKVSYWYGGRSKKELFYMDHFRKIEKDFKNFNFFVGLSEPLPEDNWEIKKKLENYKKLPLKRARDGSIITLGDVARVELGAESTRTLFKGNGKQVVGIGIYQQSDANTIAVANGIKKKIKEIKPTRKPTRKGKNLRKRKWIFW